MKNIATAMNLVALKMREKIATEPEGSYITLLSEPTFSVTSEKKCNKRRTKYVSS